MSLGCVAVTTAGGVDFIPAGKVYLSKTVSARWEPDLHPRNPADGEFIHSHKGGLLPERTPKDRLAVQTPSEFRHPVTGHLMGKTEIGDTFEALFAAKGSHLLTAKYGGDYQVISQKGSRRTPLDFQLDHLHAGELKTLNRNARNQKTAIKADEARRKNEAAKAGGMSPLLVVQVVDTGNGQVKVYAFPGFASKTTQAMTHVGDYSYTAGDFRKAQETTGHWSQQKKRALSQGVKAAAGIAPGDTVIELRDGVPWIGTEGVSAAKWEPDLHPRRPDGKFTHKPGSGLKDIAESLDWQFGSATNGDEGLAKLAALNGFNGKPKIVDDAEIDRQVAAGAVEMFRGVKDRNRGDGSSRKFADQFMHGDYYAGYGTLGNGTYAARIDRGRLYALEQEFKDEPRNPDGSFRDRLAQRMWDRDMARIQNNAYSTASGYTGAAGTMMRMTLDPKAKIVPFDQLKEEMIAFTTEKVKAGASPREMLMYSDPGRFATVKGYDAVDVSKLAPGEILILNRSMLNVSSKTTDGMGDSWQSS